MANTRDLGPPSPHAADLYRRYGAMVQRALRQLGVDHAALDDAAQDVFVVLHRRVAEFDRHRSMSNWLWGIARGVASTYRRGQRRRTRLHQSIPARAVAPIALGPDEHVARARAQRVLSHFLDTLDEDKCAVFVMSEIEGHSGREIAERLGVNVNTVYARLRAARQRFDAALRERKAAQAPTPLASFFAWPFGVTAQTAMATASYAAAVAVVVPTVHLSLAEVPMVTVRDVRAAVDPSASAKKSTWATRSSQRAAKVPIDSTYDDVVLLEGEPMQRTTLVAALTLAAAAPNLAHAKPRSTAEASPQDADAAALVDEETPNRSYIFDNDVLTGEVLNPDGTLLLHRLPPRHASLIKLRSHFMPELIALANDL